jgi:hypothetical protein
MADGFARPLLEDGVYLDLPMSEYLADPALSGSAFKTLLTDPPAWRWERPDNLLWERGETRFQLRGTAAHCAILEGIDTYEARFCVEPRREDFPDALDTMDDIKAWLKDRDAKVSGTKAEISLRAMELAAERGEKVLFWAAVETTILAGRTPIREADDAYVRMMHAFVQRDPALGPLVADGLAEVTVIWTDGSGQRLKSRLDYLNAAAVTDLKTFGRPPRRGQSLRQHVVGEVVANAYDIQAVHNTGAAAIALNMALGHVPGAIVARGDGASDRIETLQRIAKACTTPGGVSGPVFHWLFLRMGSAPTGIALPFRDGARFRHVEDEIAQARANFGAFTAAFGKDLWFRSEGIVDIQDEDFPMWAWDVAR